MGCKGVREAVEKGGDGGRGRSEKRRVCVRKGGLVVAAAVVRRWVAQKQSRGLPWGIGGVWGVD